MAFENTKDLPKYEMETGVQGAEINDYLRNKLRNKSLDVYNMSGTGGPSFGQVSGDDLDRGAKLYDSLI